MGVQDHLTCLLRNLYTGQEGTESDVKQQTSSKLGKDYVKAVYCHTVYLTYMYRECLCQSCPTLCSPMDCSSPASSVHGDSPGKNTGVGCYALFQGFLPFQGLNPLLLGLLHWQAGSLALAPPRKPKCRVHANQDCREKYQQLQYVDDTTLIAEEKTLESPLNYKEIKPVNTKGN